MAGISSKAAGKLENKFKYNGIEHNTDFDLNMYDAFYRNLDPQIGRFWQIDPETDRLEEYSPYASMYNNPISNVDPLGDFGSRFGAWLHKVFNGGGTIGENKYGEFYVQKNSSTEDGSVIVSLTYGKGRDMYSNAREALVRDSEIEADIQMNGENSMYQMYDSPQEAGNAALTYTGLFHFNLIIGKGGKASSTSSQASETTKAAEGGNNVVYHSVENGVTQYVGITNNLARRAAQHLSGKGIKIEPLMQGLSRADARAVEQALIEIHGLGSNGGTLLNKINSISPSNPAYASQLERGYELLKSIGYQ